MNFKPQLQTLANKIKLVTLDLPQSQSVTVLIMIKIGSRYESDRLAGISHFLEHLVFKGTQKYPTAFDLTSKVDSIGAEFNAFTGKEYTGFYIKSASAHLQLSLDILSQLVFHPTLPEKEMEKEKGVICEEINMREDMPMAKISEIYELLLYGNTSLGREIAGYKKTVKAMKKEDFINYLQTWYKPERMILGIVGGLHIKETPCLKNFTVKNNSSSIKDAPLALTFNQEKPQLRLEYKKTEQAHFCLGVRAFPHAHKDRYVMAVLATILGGNMSSRLFTEVREKRGLAYYIKSDINTYFDHGYFVSQAGVDINKAEEAIKVILEEYNKISNVPTQGWSASGRKSQNSKLELNRAKEYIKGKLALSLEDSHGMASLFVEDLLLDGKVRTPAEIIKSVEKVTIDDISRVAKTIFVNQGLNLAVIGPYKNKEKFAKLLKL